MASLLEQYEQATSSSILSDKHASKQPNKAGSGSSSRNPGGVVQTTHQQLNDLQPIFAKQRVDFQIPTGKSVYRMAVCDRLIILAMKDATLLRIDLKNSPDQMDTLEAKSSSPGDSVDEIFLEPSGKHMLLAMRSGECLYFGRTSKKPRPFTKLKTHILSAVGWSYEVLDVHGKTGPTLLGTAQGVIFEVEFNANAAESAGMFLGSNVENYCKQVCNLAQPDPVLIKGIFFDRLRRVDKSYVVLVATPTRLYQFKGSGQAADPPFFQEIFQLDPEKPMTNFLELPGNPRHCCLSAWRGASDQDSTSSFAWLTEPGVYYADFEDEAGSAAVSDDTVLHNSQLYTFAKDKSNRPVSLVSTEFHVLIQYPTMIRVLSKLACNIIFEDTFTDRYGKLMGICRDPSTNVVWAYTETTVYRYKITDESRDVWKIYLEKGNYDAALRYAQTNPTISNLVHVLQAENYLQKGEYEKSALIYASSDAPFEEVALKFSRLRQEKALKLLLIKRAESLRATRQLAQLFMVCSWLMEIFLNGLGQLKSSSGKDAAAYASLLVEFHQFLSNPQFLDVFLTSPEVFYSLLLSHAAHESYVFFATHLNDSRRLLEFHLERDNYREALRILATAGNNDLIYDFSPKLMRHVPKLMVDIWMSKGKLLNPHRLLPSLQRYSGPQMEEEASQIVRYLEHCIHVLGSHDVALHNYLVTMYCRMGNEDMLMAYLLTADEESERRSVELYDRKSTLRMCVENGLKRAAVSLYCTLNLHMEAVELALEFDPALAKDTAKSAMLEEDIRKRLWLLIAQHVIQQHAKDISKATEILHESGDVIKIEDILPFFPDFVTIDDFKDAICASLEDYNRHISALKGEVDEATSDAERLRTEIQDYRSQCLFITATDQCFICKQALLTHQFFIFPCKHHLHWECLLRFVQLHLPSTKQAHVEELKKRLDGLKEQGQDDSASLHSFGSANQASQVSRREMVKQELEDMVASECPFCGLLMIKSVDLPFIGNEEYESAGASWQ